MHAASRELDTNVEEFTRAACPPLLGVMPFLEGAVDHECERLQSGRGCGDRAARTAGLKGVVMAGRWPAYIGQPSPDGSLLARLSYGEVRARCRAVGRCAARRTRECAGSSGARRAANRGHRCDSGVPILRAAVPAAPATAGVLDAASGCRCAARALDGHSRHHCRVEWRRAHVRSAAILLRRHLLLSDARPDGDVLRSAAPDDRRLAVTRSGVRPGICAGCFTTSPRATTSRAARAPSRTSDDRRC